jgi:hypothetical protein
MPLDKRKSKKTISKNIKEIVSSFKKTGKIGASTPSSKKKAQKQAVAIALNTARKSPARAKNGGSVLRRDAKRRTKIY